MHVVCIFHTRNTGRVGAPKQQVVVVYIMQFEQTHKMQNVALILHTAKRNGPGCRSTPNCSLGCEKKIVLSGKQLASCAF
jgi:hypothetical protein